MLLARCGARAATTAGGADLRSTARRAPSGRLGCRQPASAAAARRRDLGLPRGRLRQRRLPSRLAARRAPVRSAASPAPPITATTLLTGTVSPSLTLISVSTPAAGDGNLGIDLVGRDLEQRLVAVDRVADLLDPADDRAFGDRLAHLGHHDVVVIVNSQLPTSNFQGVGRAAAVKGARTGCLPQLPPMCNASLGIGSWNWELS